MPESTNQKPRINLATAIPIALKLLGPLEHHALQSPLFQGEAGLKLLHLVRFRASQLNGCAYCLDMHSKDARAHGESEQRLYSLDAWRETPFFSDKEKAALEWTESLTLISENHVPDDLFERVKAHLSEPELIDLTLAVVAINAWNRLAIPFRAVPGNYQPPAAK